MERLIERCCGLDAHKATVTASSTVRRQSGRKSVTPRTCDVRPA